ncbi:MAG: hypothetical protein LBQ24_02800 [Candidatus Peribacteria bacterium]|jgi:hypothetical protein|nr:hypothetical protein [Candidatus Peribacteria bacterium]
MKIFKKIKTFFSKKEKDKKNLFLTKDPKSSLVKKRKHLKVNFDFLRHLEFFKRKYIPYFLIFSIIFAIIVAILIFGPFFRVKYIEIIKKDDITNMDIAYKAVDFFR